MPLGLGTKFTKLSLLQFLPLTYHHSHFLATTLDFTSFFTIAFLRVALFFFFLLFFFFTVWLFWIRFHFFLYLYTPKPGLLPALGLLSYHFFFTTARKKNKMKQILNTLTNSDFISKCTNYIYIIQIHTLTVLHVNYFLWITCLQLISLLGDLKCS